MRKHLTYANVMATIAVFGVLGGGAAYAANTIGSSDIINGQVKSPDIGNNQVFSADVRDDTLSGGGLGAGDLAPHSVRSNEVANDSLTGTDIAESSLGEVPSAALGGLGGESPLANSAIPMPPMGSSPARTRAPSPSPPRPACSSSARSAPTPKWAAVTGSANAASGRTPGSCRRARPSPPSRRSPM